MRYSPVRLYPRTAVATFVIDRLFFRPVETLDHEARVKARQAHYPNVPPFTWVVGAVPRGVRTSAASATARDGHPVPLRIHRPSPRALGALPGPPPVVMWFHGGGWVLGGPRGYDAICGHLAEHVGAVVVNVDYRLAPEHRAPTAAYDAVDATRWVAAHAGELGVDGSRIGVAGDSAGGQLSAVVSQQAALGEAPPIAVQGLIYPGTDMTLSSPSLRENANAPALTLASIEEFRRLYLPDGYPPELERDPLVSPLFGAVEGVAPALVQVAELDPLRDDGVRYADKLRDAGVPVRLTQYAKVPHGYLSYPGAVPSGTQARAELVAELRRYLHPA